MKKIILFMALFFIPLFVKANSINNIRMDIYIDASGTAHVTEVWDAKLNEGTEGYKPYYNLGESTISNFQVKMGNKEFTYNDNWNTSDSFEEKSYHNGINYLSDGVELCFGISSYGQNTYTLSYDISNFVVNTSDNYQMVYWTLFPHDYNPSPARVYVKIYSDFRYSDTLDIWGYGKYGMPTYVYDGYIEIDSEGKVYNDEYITILIKFPSGSFASKVTLDKSFEEYYNMAEEGAVSYSDNNKSSALNIFLSVLPILITFSLIIFAMVKVSTASKYGTYRLNFGETKNKVKDVVYYRDLPYKKEELSRVYWIACQYNLISKQTDYLGAILLKWFKLGNIRIEKKTSSKKFSDKEETVIVFSNCMNLSELETKLYQMMYEASADGNLEKKEFELWCKKNYTKILRWFNDVVDSETEKLISEGLLIREGRIKKCIVKPIMMEEAKKIAGVKKFLLEFSNIKDKSSIEVNLWEEYLMYAQIFGIAKKVMKEFKDMYPDVITEEIYSNIDFIYFVSYSGMNSATTARNRANSYSAGGGGFSSGGGGIASFGGGGGGGGFR